MQSCVGSVTVTDSSVPILCRTYGFWEKPAILHSIQIDLNTINQYGVYINSKIYF